MKIQAISVSVNYADFLCHTLKENHKLFDKWIIVTDTKDLATKRECDYYPNVICIQTDVFYVKARFNKYAGINEGLKHVDKNGWILFLDADMVLHNNTKRVLDNINLDPGFIYGIDRLRCMGAQKWEDYKLSPKLVINNWLLTDAGFKFGSRLIHIYGFEGGRGEFEGWNPIGFFQLAHGSAFTTYPQESDSAQHCDLLFARQWPRSKRMLIPELIGIHLESISAFKSINWWGRISEPFTIESTGWSLKYLRKAFFRRLWIWLRNLFEDLKCY